MYFASPCMRNMRSFQSALPIEAHVSLYAPSFGSSQFAPNVSPWGRAPTDPFRASFLPTTFSQRASIAVT